MTVLLTLPGAQAPTTVHRARALVFEDPKSRALQARIQRFAPSDATILITGETGTGKEIVARYVHELSRRAARPFLAVNCGAIAESLIESELFGHVRGAFTGATSDKIGWFEAAEGGTLFLDEIGDLPPHLQVKLLRVLQEREVVRLGSHRPVPVDVRLVAATNVNLDDAIDAGQFRDDLYYRLVVARIGLDPLRNRPGDILPLARHFVAHYAMRIGSEGAPRPALVPAAEQKLLEHPWPGNIRELENAIHHALLVCQGGRIEPEDLPAAAPGHGRSLAQPADLHTARAPGPVWVRGDSRLTDEASGGRAAFQRALAILCEEGGPRLWKEIEEAVFRTAYAHAGFNQLKTARLLGLTRSIVRARLLEFEALAPPVPPSGSASPARFGGADAGGRSAGLVPAGADDPAIRQSPDRLLQ